jgi:hypothetical protein
MELNRKAQGFMPEYVVQTIIIIVILAVLIGVSWVIFTGKVPLIWRSIVNFMRFGTA